MTFYERIQKILASKNMNFADLSRIIGISQPSMNGWKNGSIPRSDVGVRIAKALDTTVEYLVTGEESEIPKEILDAAYEISRLPPMLRNIVLSTLESCKSQQSELEKARISDAG